VPLGISSFGVACEITRRWDPRTAKSGAFAAAPGLRAPTRSREPIRSAFQRVAGDGFALAVSSARAPLRMFRIA
jgi:hypothetical protein